MVPYVIRSARGGISDENDKGIPGSFKYGYGLDIHSRDDVLKAGSTVATIFGAGVGETGTGTGSRGTTLNSHFNIIVPSFDGSTYFFGATGSIFARSEDGYWTNVYNDEEGITGAAEFGNNDGAYYMYWGKSTSIAQRQMGGTFDTARDSGTALWTNATNVWKTEYIQSTAVWHTFKQASGSLMMANGDGLAVIEFDGDFDPFAMTVRPGNIINTLDERDDYVVMGSQRLDKSEEGHIWNWIDTATNWVQKKKLPIQGVNALIEAESYLSQGGDDGEIFASDFVNTVPLATVPERGRVNPGGVTVHEDLATFGFFGGTYPGIWTYGRRNKNRANALNYQYRLAPTVGGSTIGTIGAIAVINGELIASWGTSETGSSAYGVDAVSSTSRATALYEGLEFDKGQAWDERMVDTAKAIFKPLVSGTSFSIKYKADNESAWRYAVFAGGGTTFSTADATEATASVGKPAHIFEPGVEITPSGSDTPEIHEVTFYLANKPDAF